MDFTITVDEAWKVIKSCQLDKFSDIQRELTSRVGRPLTSSERKNITAAIRITHEETADMIRLRDHQCNDTLSNESILLITAYSDNYAIGKITENINRSYATKQGHPFLCKVLSHRDMLTAMYPKTGCSWYKILFLRELFEDIMIERDNIKYIMWIDADALVVNDSMKISDIIGRAKYKDLIIAEDVHIGNLINAGVFIMRNSEWNRKFLEQVWNCDKYNDVTFYEQSAIIRQLRRCNEGIQQVQPFHSYCAGAPVGIKSFAHVSVLPHLLLNTNCGIDKSDILSFQKAVYEAGEWRDFVKAHQESLFNGLTSILESTALTATTPENNEKKHDNHSDSSNYIRDGSVGVGGDGGDCNAHGVKRNVDVGIAEHLPQFIYHPCGRCNKMLCILAAIWKFNLPSHLLNSSDDSNGDDGCGSSSSSSSSSNVHGNNNTNNSSSRRMQDIHAIISTWNLRSKTALCPADHGIAPQTTPTTDPPLSAPFSNYNTPEIEDRDGGTTVLVVGGGPTGISAACYLHKTSRLKVTVLVLEKGPAVGARGPFNENNKEKIRLGAQMASFNVSEVSASSLLTQLLTADPPIIQECDESLLSETQERPRGWNRLTGQWKHTSLVGENSISRLLQVMVNRSTACAAGSEGQDERRTLDMKCDALVQSFDMASSIDNQSKKWIVRTDDDVEYRCDALILALPAKDIRRIIDPLSLDIVPQHIRDALSKSEEMYTTRFACVLSVFRTSELGVCMLKKFFIASNDEDIPPPVTFAREIDVSNVGSKTVTLISLVQDCSILCQCSHREEISKEDEASQVVNFILHSNSREDLAKPTLLLWLKSWLGVEVELDSVVAMGVDGGEDNSAVSRSGENYEEFRQAGFSWTPLSPLPERGCLSVGGGSGGSSGSGVDNSSSSSNGSTASSSTSSTTRGGSDMSRQGQGQGQGKTPHLVLCGDWAVGSGTVSGALLSGEKAAKTLIKLFEEQAEAEIGEGA